MTTINQLHQNNFELYLQNESKIGKNEKWDLE